jgi:hypothetical protein
MFRHITMTMTTMMIATLALLSWGTRAEAASYNVRLAPYSAAGNGSTDDTGAVQGAINAAVAAGGGEVYLPAGTYRLLQTLTIYGPITLRGEGQRTSVLLWDGLTNGNDGIWFASQGLTIHQTITVRSLSLIRHNGTGGAALNVNWPNLGASGNINFATGGGVTTVIEDVHISATGWPTTSQYWDRGIVLANAAAAKIATFNIQGAGAEYGTAGLDALGAPNGSGVPGRSVGVAIHDGQISGYTFGVRIRETSEVINAQHLVIRDVILGVEMLNAGKGTSISNNQIWTRIYGVRLYNSVGDAAITSNRIYRETDTPFVGIEINNDTGSTDRVRVIGNYVWSTTGTSQPHTGIMAANNVNASVIYSNTTVNMTTGILLANAPVDDTLVHANRNRNAGTAFSVAASTNPYQANNY